MKVRKSEYKLGDLINGRKLIKIKGGLYYVICPKCGKTACGYITQVKTRNCVCKRIYSNRYSGLNYVNSKKRLEQIKNKYKNGVTAEILNEFMKTI